MEEVTVQCISLMGHPRPINHVRFNHDGDIFLTASVDGFCRAWRTYDGQYLGRYGPLKDSNGTIGKTAEMQGIAVNDACFSADTSYVVVAYQGEFCAIYEALSGRLLSILKKDDIFGVNAVCFSLDGTKVIAATDSPKSSCKDRLLIWDVTTITSPTLVKEIVLPSGVRSMALLGADSHVVLGFKNGSFRVYNLKTYEIDGEDDLEYGPVKDTRVYRDSFIVFTCEKNHIFLYGANDYEYVAEFTTDFPVHTATINPRVPLMCYAGGMDTKAVTQQQHEEDTFRIFFHDPMYNERLAAITKHIGPVHCLDWSFNGCDLVSAGEDGVAYLWKFGEELLSYKFEDTW